MDSPVPWWPDFLQFAGAPQRFQKRIVCESAAQCHGLGVEHASRKTRRKMKAIFAALAMAFSLFASDVEKGNFGAEAPTSATKSKTITRGKRNSYPFSGEIESHDGKS